MKLQELEEVVEALRLQLAEKSDPKIAAAMAAVTIRNEEQTDSDDEKLKDFD